MLAVRDARRSAARRGHEHCSGCSLCLLGCPVWWQRRDIRFTPQGRAKAIQHGAGAEVIAESVGLCTLCGSCEPACPERIPLVDLMLELRRESPLPGAAALSFEKAAATPRAPGGTVLLADAALRADLRRLERCAALLGAVSVADDGADIALAVEAGAPVPEPRMLAFLGGIRGARRVVAANGLLARLLRAWMPNVTVAGLGEALGALPGVRSKLRADDLYVIEPRAFHAEHARLLGHYDRLARDTGATLSLDLQRMALSCATGTAQQALGLPAIDTGAQSRWIMQGRVVARVVVEAVQDLEPLSAVAGVPVVHLTDL